MKPRLMFIVLAALVLCAGTVHADNDNIAISADRSMMSVDHGKSAFLEINLSSKIDDILVFSIKDTKTWISLNEQQLRVNASERNTVRLYATPTKDVFPVSYRIEVIAQSSATGEKKSLVLFISVIKAEYDIMFKDLVVTGEFRPTGKINIVPSVKNSRSITVPDVEVKLELLSSTRKIISETRGMFAKIEPNETASINISWSLPKNLPDGKYTLAATVVVDGNNLDEMESDTFQVQKVGIIELTESVSFGFIGVGEKFVYENVGNDKNDSLTLEKDLGGLATLYVGTEPTEEKDGKYIWTFSVAVGETKTIEYYINYLLIIIVVIIIAAIAWYVLNAIMTVYLSKKILHQKKIEDGTQFTVGVEIKNNTGRQINDIVIRDFVPSVFKFLRTATSIKPIERRTPVGTELIWRIRDMGRGETRVVSYAIQSTIGVTGQLRLPAASARYRYKALRLKRDSNTPVLGETDKDARNIS
ncbi:MAG: hypothetical protein ABIG30_01885 [Candidatus Aenigmatarchaeota archaeon]